MGKPITGVPFLRQEGIRKGGKQIDMEMSDRIREEFEDWFISWHPHGTREYWFKTSRNTSEYIWEEVSMTWRTWRVAWRRQQEKVNHLREWLDFHEADEIIHDNGDGTRTVQHCCKAVAEAFRGMQHRLGLPTEDSREFDLINAQAAIDPCPKCGTDLRAKSLAEGGGVKCPNPDCDYWFCY